MKILPSKFANVAAFLGFSLCTSKTLSTEESTALDAADVLQMAPPVFVEMEANNMMPPCVHKTVPPPVNNPPPPRVHNPTPPSTNNAAQRANVAQNEAMQMANRQFQLQTNGIAVYVATKLQRQVAEAHARAYMAALQRADAEDSASSESGRTEKRLTTLKKQPGHKKRRRRHKHHPRYIAVDTVRDKRASRNANKVVMIWDTQSETLVGNNVYDVKAPPSLGKTIIFDTYSAEYVGDGTKVPENELPTPLPNP